MDRVALEVFFRGNIARRLDARVGQFQDLVVASGNDGALPSPVFGVGQSSARHFSPNRGRIFTGQQPAHAAFDLCNFHQASPIRWHQIGRLLIQPREQFRHPLEVHFHRARERQLVAKLQRRRQALATIGRQIRLPQASGRRRVSQVVGVPFNAHQVQQRGVPQNPRARVVAHSAPGAPDGGGHRRHV